MSFLAQNKKAFVDYEIKEKFEAGIVLTGAEVKSIRLGHASLKGSFVEISEKNEAFTRNLYISPYKHAVLKDYLPDRKRKLLLNHKEIMNLNAQIKTKSVTIIPLDFHIHRNKIKITIGICKAKKKFDRREELKKKAQNLEIDRELKKYRH